MNDFESTLGTALRDRVDHEQPDLQRLVGGSIRSGLRMRRRRRVAVAAAGVAGVAAIAVGSSLLADTGSPRSSAPEVATEPTATPTSTEQPRPTDIGPLEEYLAELSLGYGVDPAKRFFEVYADTTVEQREQISALLPLDWELQYVDPDAPVVGLVDEVPATVPQGWECEWFLVDDKASCTAADGGVAGLVIRPAEDHAEWSASPDKGGAGSGSYVTDVHDGIFISVQGGLGTTYTELRALCDGLVWKD